MRAVRYCVTSTFDHADKTVSIAPEDALRVLVWFGASMLRAGNTAARTREWMSLLARKMDFEVGAIFISFDSIAASVDRRGSWLTAMREIGPPVARV